MTTVFVYEDVTASGAGGDPGSSPAPSLLAEGRAMRDAVSADFAAVPDVRVLSLGSPAFCDLASRADYTLVIAPECAGRLEHLCREVLRVGGRLLGPAPDAIRLTADKLKLSQHWDRCGVPSPATWELGDEPAGMDVVIKPRDGAGSQAILLRKADGELNRAAVALAPASGSGSPGLAQEYVSGFAASVAFLVGYSTTVPLIPCAQLLTVDGRFRYLGGRLPIAPDRADRALRVATAAIDCVPGLLGYVGVDVILGDDSRDWAIEINPRLTTSYVGLRALARFNLAEAMLAVVRGATTPTMTWGSEAVSFTPTAVNGNPTRPAQANT